MFSALQSYKLSRTVVAVLCTIAFVIVMIAAALLVGGCTDAEKQQVESLGSKHRVTLYGCDGKVIHQWTATGNVSNNNQSDGWYFRDEATGKLVEIAGTITIEQE